MKRITATEASRNFSRILDEAEHDGESFVVERNGRPVAEIRPARPRRTIRELVEFFERTPAPDPDFWDDVLAARDASRRMRLPERWRDAE